mmetsp:Transcript_50729/g.127828  ORF Transcript_50729/g.127828 Transcript_50729/m.127828 type:complete len:309 (+) Transcript_50729:81-1007(+)
MKRARALCAGKRQSTIYYHGQPLRAARMLASLQHDLRTGSDEFVPHRFGLVSLDAFLDDFRRTLHKLLGLLEAQLRDSAYLFDHVDFLCGLKADELYAVGFFFLFLFLFFLRRSGVLLCWCCCCCCNRRCCCGCSCHRRSVHGHGPRHCRHGHSWEHAHRMREWHAAWDGRAVPRCKLLLAKIAKVCSLNECERHDLIDKPQDPVRRFALGCTNLCALLRWVLQLLKHVEGWICEPATTSEPSLRWVQQGTASLPRQNASCNTAVMTGPKSYTASQQHLHGFFYPSRTALLARMRDRNMWRNYFGSGI